MQKVRVAGAGMSKFGKFLDRGLRDLAEEAVRNTLEDTGIDVKEINAAYVSNSVAGLITGQETIRGQVVLRKTGLMGIPIVNVENACASASTAFHLGWTAVASGMYDCVLALGVEKLSDPDKAKSLRAFNSAVDVSELAEIEKRLGRSSEGGKDRSLFMDLYISMLSSGVSLLYASFFPPAKYKDRQGMKLSQLVETVSKKPIPSHQQEVIFEMVAEDMDEQDVEVPYIKMKMRRGEIRWE